MRSLFSFIFREIFVVNKRFFGGIGVYEYVWESMECLLIV